MRSWWTNRWSMPRISRSSPAPTPLTRRSSESRPRRWLRWNRLRLPSPPSASVFGADMVQPDQTRLDFLLDVDNTLLDNDRLKSDLDASMRKLIGDAETDRFWDVYEQVRRQEDYVDYPASIKSWGEQYGTADQEKALLQMIDEIDFASYLYPHALDTIAHLWSFGTVAILSDGDTVSQPMKIRKSGLEEAVHGNVVITIHKELEMKQVFDRFPADNYV